MAVSKVIGLDIGSSSVKMAEISRAKGYQLDFVGVAPLPDGSIAEKAIQRAEFVGEAIKALHKHSKSKTKKVATSLSGKSVIIKQATMSAMSDSQLEKQIRMEAEPYIPFDIKDVHLDFFIMGERPEREGTMDVILVAAKKEYMDEYLKLISSLGLTTVVVDVDPFALESMYEVCYPNVQEEVVALINIGASTLNVNILKSGASQYTRDLQVGGESVTKEIMRFFDFDFERAENIKRGARLDDVNPRNLRKIFQRSIDSYIAELQKIFDFYSSNVAGSHDPVQKVFLSGGASRTYGLVEAMEADLNLPVEMVDPFRSLKIDEKVFDLKYLAEVAPTMAVAVGLALRHEEDKRV
jgi:type IV pilus assembly protein PilM